MRVLIIGGTGLISTAISREFLAHGVDLTLFNRGVSDSRIPDGQRSSLEIGMRLRRSSGRSRNWARSTA